LDVGNPFASRYIKPSARDYLFRRDGQFLANDTQLVALAEKIRAFPRSSIVGPHGSGKSTLIQSLQPHLTNRFCELIQVTLHHDPSCVGFSRVHEKIQHAVRLWNAARQSGKNRLLIVDGIEQISFVVRVLCFAYLRLVRAHLLVTSHGRLFGVPVLFQTEVTAALIQSLATMMVAPAGERIEAIVRQELARRDLNQVKDLRSLWFELFDRVQAECVRLAIEPVIRFEVHSWPQD
jgi:predicted AAA+ superfamily ATPase